MRAPASCFRRRPSLLWSNQGRTQITTTGACAFGAGLRRIPTAPVCMELPRLAAGANAAASRRHSTSSNARPSSARDVHEHELAKVITQRSRVRCSPAENPQPAASACSEFFLYFGALAPYGAPLVPARDAGGGLLEISKRNTTRDNRGANCGSRFDRLSWLLYPLSTQRKIQRPADSPTQPSLLVIQRLGPEP